MTGLPFHSCFKRIRRGKKTTQRAIKMPQERDGITKNLAGSCRITRSSRNVTFNEFIMFSLWMKACLKRHCKKMKMIFQEERANNMNIHFKNSSINNLQISNGNNSMQQHSSEFDQGKTNIPGRVESRHPPVTHHLSGGVVLPFMNPPDMTIPCPSDKGNLYARPSSRHNLMQAETLKQKKTPHNLHGQRSQFDSVHTETVDCDFYPKRGLFEGDDCLFDLSDIDDGGVIDGLDPSHLPLDLDGNVSVFTAGNNSCAGWETSSQETVTTKCLSSGRVCSSEVPKTETRSSLVKIRSKYDIDGKKITDNSDCLDANESKLHVTRKFGNKEFNLTQPTFFRDRTDSSSARFNAKPELSHHEKTFIEVETRDDRSMADTGQSSQEQKVGPNFKDTGKYESFAFGTINADQNLVEEIKTGIAEPNTHRQRAKHETSETSHAIYDPSSTMSASFMHVDNGGLLGTSEAHMDSLDQGGEESAVPVVCGLPAKSYHSSFNVNKGKENAAIDFMSRSKCAVTLKDCHPIQKSINHAELNYSIQETTDNSCAVYEQVVF